MGKTNIKPDVNDWRTAVRPYGREMKYDRKKHHRRSIRLKEYDYSQPGAYFVTICTHNEGMRIWNY